MKRHFVFNYSQMFGAHPKQQLSPFNDDEAFTKYENTSNHNYLITNQLARDTGSLMIASFCAENGVLKAVSRYLIARYYSVKGFGGYAWLHDGSMIFDYYDGTADYFNKHGGVNGDYSSSPHILLKITPEMEMSAVCVDEYGTKMPYCIETSRYPKGHTGKHSGCAWLFAVLGILVERKEAQQFTSSFTKPIDAVISSLQKGSVDWESLAAVCRNLYDAVNYNAEIVDFYGTEGFCDLKGLSENIPMLDLSKPFDIDTETVTGDISRFFSIRPSVQKTEAVTEARTMADYAGMYRLHPERMRTAEEMAMIQRVYDLCKDQVPDQKTVRTARSILESTDAVNRFREALFYGEAGSGKSTAAMHLSLMLDLPYLYFTCNADTDFGMLTETVLPRSSENDKATDIAGEMKKYPSIADIFLNPADAYKRVTGTEKADATSEEVQTAVYQKLTESSSSVSQFEYVRSAVMQAFVNGWLVEIQEPDLIVKQGVLPGMNKMFDLDAQLTTSQQKVYSRHPDCIFVITMNNSYEGCKALNESIKDRFRLKYQFELADEDSLVQRVMSNTNYRDELVIRKMIKVMYDIRTLSEEEFFTGGTTGIRCLEAWALETRICGDPYEAAYPTIVESTSSDKDDKAKIETAVAKQFSKHVTKSK